MEPVWLNSYPKGVPHEIDLDEFSSVTDVFLQSCAKHKEQPAYTSFDHTVSFGEVERLTKQFATYLQRDLGLKKGDRLAIMLPNVIQYPIAVLSAMRLGLIIVNIDPMYTQRELKIQFNDSGAETVIVLENFAAEVEKAMAEVPVKNVIVTKIGDCLPLGKGFLINALAKHVKKVVPGYNIPKALSFKNVMTKYRGKTDQLVEPDLGHDDLLFLQYTGGTTGVPKGVEITHGNMVANIQMSKSWIQPSLAPGVQHRIIAPLPMYHIFCMSVNLMVMMSLGAEISLSLTQGISTALSKYCKRIDLLVSPR